MKNYNKPMVKICDGNCEGIYMASGCYTVTAYIHQRPEIGRDDFRIQVNAKHAANHTCSEQILTITFNSPVEYLFSNGTLVSGNGTNTLNIKYNYWNNPNDSIGLGDLCVKSNDFNLEILKTVMTDNGKN